MAKIKGWKKIKNQSGDIVWKGDDGDQVRVIFNQQLGRKEDWLMGANGQLHIKKTNTKSQALTYARAYMKAHPRG